MLHKAFRAAITTIMLFFVMLRLGACAGRDGFGAGAQPGPVVRVRHVDGVIWSSAMSHAGILYQDGAAAIACDGGSLWVFGDTFLGRNRDGVSFPPSKESAPRMQGSVSATIAWLPADAPAEFPPRLRYLVDETGRAQGPLVWREGESPEKLRMWPLGGTSIRGTTYMYYSMIEITDASPPWNFRGIGGGLARSGTPLGIFERLAPNGDWRFPVEAICAFRRDGFVYLFEVAGDGDKRGLHLARVTENEIEHPQRYEYCTGVDIRGAPRWSSNRSELCVVLTDVYGQFSMTWSPNLNAYLAVTSSNVFHPEELQFRTASQPWGPWSRPTRIAVPPHTRADNAEPSGKKTRLVYCAALHPELSSADGADVVLTYCRMLEGDWELSNPEMMRVWIGPGGP